MTKISYASPVVGGDRKAITPTTVRRSDAHQALLIMIDGMAAVVAVRVAGGVATGAVAFLAAAVGLDLLDRHHVQRLSLSALDRAPTLALRGIAIASVASAAGLPIYGHRGPGAGVGVGPLITALLYVVIAVAGLGIGYAVLLRLQADGRLASPALIIGAGPLGAKIGWRLREHPGYGLVPLGFVDSALPARSDLLPAPLLGDVTELPKLIAEHGIRHVFVAFSQMRDVDLVELLRVCDRMDCEIFVVPRLYELGAGVSPATDHLWGIPLIHLRRAPFRSHTWTLKRISDIVLAGGALVVISPLMAAIAVALRLELGRGVLFRQIRIGLEGQPFQLLKFRTLRPRLGGVPGGWCDVNPDQMGPVGRFLRRSSLDELPQLWNVLRGHMSLVGPRPEQPHYVEQFVREHRGYRERLRVPAGVTGLAQVNDLRGDTPIEDRVCFDNFYIEHWSLWQDIKIMIRTVASVIGLRGG
jgi:exopolysaccharide biosynthesis polyprenyl glycosylphosphotransferase